MYLSFFIIMLFIKVIFWILIGIILYAYIGYGILLMLLVTFKRIFKKHKPESDADYEPEVTLFVTAYNEKDHVELKVKNSFELDYPKEKLKFIWVTDGSDDGTPELLKCYPEIEVYHQPERSGKAAAMNRGMNFVKTPVVIFCDGNTLLSENSARSIIHAFRDMKAGCVSGEKRIICDAISSASGSGEGFYWKYESKLKHLDSELYSTVGAAGELFAIRTELYEPLENDTILDDFILSMKIALKGYIVKYVSDAYAYEMPSENVREEMKRKVRIAAGGFQSVSRLLAVLNIFKHGWLTFQFISHKLLRWSLVPLSFICIIPLNIILSVSQGGVTEISLYTVVLYGQILFYLMVLAGFIFQNKKVKFKMLFVPYYLIIMNVSIISGFFRFLSGNQTVNWERAKRQKSDKV